MQYFFSNLNAAKHSAKHSMKHKLSWYMLVLAALLIATVCLGLFSLGRLNSPKAEISHKLQTQLEFFQDDMRYLWQNVATSGVHLSSDLSDIMDDYLAQNGTSIDALAGNIKAITAIEDAMLEPMCQYIHQTRCSGAFVVLNSSLRKDNGPDIHSGLYIQKNNAERSGSELLLFRGIANVGKKYNIMPHRKWRQEFDTAQFPCYDDCINASANSTWGACRITNLTELPSTSEKAILLTVPLTGKGGAIYGICGFAVNQTYFGSHYEQPSDFKRLACVFTANTGDTLNVDAGLLAYTANGSCTLPSGILDKQPLNGELTNFIGESYDFVGKTASLNIVTGADGNTGGHTLAVLIPREDYNRALLGGVLQTVLFGLALILLVLACCMYFARRYLKPVYEDMVRLQAENPDREQMTFNDFEPLTESITAREETHKALVSTLEDEKATLEGEKASLEDAKAFLENEKATLQSQFTETQNQLELAQADAKELATRRRGEFNPDDYTMFLQEYQKLTDKQRLVLHDMAEGLSPQESAEHLNYQKSTIYSYRRDIYDKLNITGKDKLQQLRLRVAMLRQDNTPTEPTEPLAEALPEATEALSEAIEETTTETTIEATVTETPVEE